MHKGIILITPANDRQDAFERIHEFLKDYDENNANAINPIWDWWVLGGRRESLFPKDTIVPIAKAKKIIKEWRKSVDEHVEEYEEMKEEKDSYWKEYYQDKIEKIKKDLLTNDSNVYLIKTEVNIISKELFSEGIMGNIGTHNITDSLLDSLIESKENPDKYYAAIVDIHY